MNHREMTVADHPILLPLGSDEQALVEILGERWLQNRRWPVFDYLNRKLFTTVGADATETMSRLPVAQRHSIEVYRLVFTERGGPFPEPDQRVGLTVAGLYHLPQARDLVSQIVCVVRYLAEADAALEPDPDHPVSLDVPILDLLTTNLRVELKGWSPEVLAAALEHEPPLWGTVQHGPDRIGLRAGRLSLFGGVADADDYLRRVIRLLGADAPLSAAPAVLSPLDLPEALGYLDAVWRVRFGAYLLGRTQPASLARLALPCASSDEFDARLSALADVLGHLEVDLPPEAEVEAKRAGERSLARLSRRLERELQNAALDRAVSAIRTLQNVVRIRVGAQHSGLAGETAEIFRQLRLPYPPSDPAAAWESIRGVTATAVDAIREELQAAELPS